MEEQRHETRTRVAVAAPRGRGARRGRLQRRRRGASGGGRKGTVNIAVNPWVGYDGRRRRRRLRPQGEDGLHRRTTKDLKEDVSWQGFESGEVDVILENWGHPDLEKIYIDGQEGRDGRRPDRQRRDHRLVRPEVVRRRAPDILPTGKNLNKYADLFKTSESGDKGQFLGTDPSFVQYDEALDQEPRPELQGRLHGQRDRHDRGDPAGREQKKPLIGYWWDPHWLNSTGRARPGQAAGVHRRAATPTRRRSPATTRSTPLTRSSAPSSTTSGGDAATLIKNFKWTNADQNSVADYITNDGHDARGSGQEVGRRATRPSGRPGSRPDLSRLEPQPTSRRGRPAAARASAHAAARRAKTLASR